jgi:hypothetical protein
MLMMAPRNRLSSALNFYSETPSGAFPVVTYIMFMEVIHKVDNSSHLLKLEPSKGFGLIACAKLVAPNIVLST